MPRLTFKDIYTRVESISNVTSQRNLIKDAIQMGLDRATAFDLPYLMTEGYITLVAPYETGTVTITNNSKTVTGLATVFTADMVGRKIRFNNDTAYYRIASYTSALIITLETVYQGDDDTDATYSIYKDEYKLPADVDVYKVMRQIENGIALGGLEASAFDLYEPVPTAQGSPSIEILTGTRLDTYTTGTVSGTVNTSVITGASTEWTSVEGLSKGSRITIGTNVYTVKSIDSDTQITIYEKLVVTVTALTTYSILLDNLIIQLYSIPNQIENIYFRYQRIPAPLYNDEDVPDMPDKWQFILIYAGLAWAWMVKDKDEATKQELIFDKMLASFWARAGSISSMKSFPRRSLDDMYTQSTKNPRASGYGIPFSIR